MEAWDTDGWPGLYTKLEHAWQTCMQCDSSRGFWPAGTLYIALPCSTYVAFGLKPSIRVKRKLNTVGGGIHSRSSANLVNCAYARGRKHLTEDKVADDKRLCLGWIQTSLRPFTAPKTPRVAKQPVKGAVGRATTGSVCSPRKNWANLISDIMLTLPAAGRWAQLARGKSQNHWQSKSNTRLMSNEYKMCGYLALWWTFRCTCQIQFNIKLSYLQCCKVSIKFISHYLGDTSKTIFFLN